MSAREAIGKWWRIGMLVLLVTVSLYALFVPGGLLGSGDSAAIEGDADGSEEVGIARHNLAFGLGLDGGARISAPPEGSMIPGLEPTTGDPSGDLRDTVRTELDLPPEDVKVRVDRDEGTYTVEVFTNNVSDEAFADAASSVDGVDVTADDVEDGVTQATRDEMITVIESKLNEAGLAGGRAYDTETLGGEHFVVSEAPGYTTGELRSFLSERGTVRIVAHYPNPDGEGMRNETVLEEDDFTDIDSPEYNAERGQYEVLVSVTEDAAPGFQDRLNEIGFTTEGTDRCSIEEGPDGNFDFDTQSEQWCLLTISEGEVIAAHSMGDRNQYGGPGLATDMRNEIWANDPTFVMTSSDRTEAHQLSINLRAGTLTAPLDFRNAQLFSVEPALAQQFKGYSLLIGILAVISVSGMVYLRYRDRRVAAPMIVTALAEVLILLGFAAAIRMPLDLAHVAGFIAVVGTGVDDLVIIADQVMDEGDVAQRRVFDSRFRKAFWIIGAAAATTIVAMSPLAVMSLGDLRGFAIITILGVLIGVLVTRPAYGDILRKLLTAKR